MRLLLLVCAHFVGTVSGGFAACPDNMEFFHQTNSCFGVLTTTMTYYDCRASCRAIKGGVNNNDPGHVAWILDKETGNCIKGWLPRKRTWIGLSDAIEKEKFLWEGMKSPNEAMYFNWGQDEPSNANYKLNVIIETTGDWKKYSGQWTANCLCEVDADVPPVKIYSTHPLQVGTSVRNAVSCSFGDNWTSVSLYLPYGNSEAIRCNKHSSGDRCTTYVISYSGVMSGNHKIEVDISTVQRHDEGIWMCLVRYNGTVFSEAEHDVKVFEPAKEINCNHTLTQDSLKFSCVTPRIYPTAVCSWKYKQDVKAFQRVTGQLLPADTSRTVDTINGRFFESLCAISVIIDDEFTSLRGNLTFQVTMYPAIKDIDTIPAFSGTLEEHTVEISLPQTELVNCPIPDGPNQGYISEKDTTKICRCGLKKAGMPPGQPQWLDENGKETGATLNDSLPLIYNSADPKPRFACRGESVLGSGTSVFYEPQFAYGPKSITMTVHEGSGIMNKYHPDRSFITYCDIPKNIVNPKPTMTVTTSDGGTVTPLEVTETPGLYRYKFKVTPEKGGVLTVTCVSSNAIFPNDLKAYGSKTVTVNEWSDMECGNGVDGLTVGLGAGLGTIALVSAVIIGALVLVKVRRKRQVQQSLYETQQELQELREERVEMRQQMQQQQQQIHQQQQERQRIQDITNYDRLNPQDIQLPNQRDQMNTYAPVVRPAADESESHFVMAEEINDTAPSTDVDHYANRTSVKPDSEANADPKPVTVSDKKDSRYKNVAIDEEISATGSHQGCHIRPQQNYLNVENFAKEGPTTQSDKEEEAEDDHVYLEPDSVPIGCNTQSTYEYMN